MQVLRTTDEITIDLLGDDAGAEPVEFVAPLRPVVIDGGATLYVAVQLVNRSRRVLVRQRDKLHRVGGGRPTTFTDRVVKPGQTATYRVPISAPADGCADGTLLVRFVDPSGSVVHPVRLLFR